MDKKIVLNEREMEIISILSEVLELSPKQTVKESLLSILYVVRKKCWTKYEFHEYNIAARSFIKICRKFNLYDRVPLEFKNMFPEREMFDDICF